VGTGPGIFRIGAQVPAKNGDKSIVVNWKGAKLSNYGDTFDAAIKVKDSEVEEFIQAFVKAGMTREIFLANLGYLGGYYDPKTANKIYKKFNTQHPIFADLAVITPQEAYDIGKKIGAESVKKTKKKAKGNEKKK
jgi:hypothetical protein